MNARLTQPEKEKLQLEIDKLRRENAKLEREVRLPARIAATIVPQITAFVAMLGIMISLYTLHEQGKTRSDEANEKAFQQALSMATDPTGGGDRRVSGIYQLRRFWATDREALIVGATISSLLLIPNTVQGASTVRCAAAEAINGAYDKSLTSTRTLDIPRLLYGQGNTGSSGLVMYQNFVLNQANILKVNRKESGGPDAFDKNIGCLTPLAATREAIRKGWPDLRNTNLAFTDLDAAQLYQADLHAATLTRASLNGTNLHCANLSSAALYDVDLQNTDVTLANIQGAFANKPPLEEFKKRGAIELSDEQWQTWKKRGFDGQLLINLLGGKLPESLKDRISTPDMIWTLCNS